MKFNIKNTYYLIPVTYYIPDKNRILDNLIFSLGEPHKDYLDYLTLYALAEITNINKRSLN